MSEDTTIYLLCGLVKRLARKVQYQQRAIEDLREENNALRRRQILRAKQLLEGKQNEIII